tara:strand:- start:24 stop:248 length:225 start_codon:yes stop_codon:yes gene_type:complete
MVEQEQQVQLTEHPLQDLVVVVVQVERLVELEELVVVVQAAHLPIVQPRLQELQTQVVVEAVNILVQVQQAVQV